ncbi:hypothetical protein EHS25_002899 [Saitozyma podzolica]|uniref:NADH dehydrogenase [ubiquinone] 1 alpha subcomplex subunit n=1 Tax=Saitozyma podzolica TaxID=1890683 RepID=A0A427YC66_9TREE|nr:hypothetical protein EHS25_002899 [Saitozyma podzolica]
MSLARTVRHMRAVGFKEWFRQMTYIGDAKLGRHVGTDEMGNRYFENLDPNEEIPAASSSGPSSRSLRSILPISPLPCTALLYLHCQNPVRSLSATRRPLTLLSVTVTVSPSVEYKPNFAHPPSPSQAATDGSTTPKTTSTPRKPRPNGIRGCTTSERNRRRRILSSSNRARHGLP